jgi:hypothetical protein
MGEAESHGEVARCATLILDSHMLESLYWGSMVVIQRLADSGR